MVFVASIPPWVSYPVTYPNYMARADYCNSILRDLIEIKPGLFCFKLKGLCNLVADMFIVDGIHFNGWGTYKMC